MKPVTPPLTSSRRLRAAMARLSTLFLVATLAVGTAPAEASRHAIPTPVAAKKKHRKAKPQSRARVRHHARPAEAAYNPGRPDVRAGSYLVIDTADAKVLAAQHADKAAPIASITKLMTAMVVLEAGQSLDESITIGPDEVRGTRGSASRIAPGTVLTRGELLRLALMSSENRAASALCHNYPGGQRPCIAAMNAKAAALGMSSTRYVEPTGLSPQNVSSPRDLSRLVMAAAENPVIAEYSTTPAYAVTLRRQRAEFHNTNPLVKSPAWDIALQKTGYIAEAGRCLVMRAVIDGRNVVIVLMNSWGTQTRFADARRIRAWLERRKPWNA